MKAAEFIDVRPKFSETRFLIIILGLALFGYFTWDGIDFILFGELLNKDKSDRELLFLFYLSLPVLLFFWVSLPVMLIRRPGIGRFCSSGVYLRKLGKTVHFPWHDLGSAIFRPTRGTDRDYYSISFYYRNRELLLRKRASFPPEVFVPADCVFPGPYSLKQAQELCNTANVMNAAHGIGPSNKFNAKELEDRYHWSKRSGYRAIWLFPLFFYPVFMFVTYLLLNRIDPVNGGIDYIILRIRDVVLPLL